MRRDRTPTGVGCGAWLVLALLIMVATSLAFVMIPSWARAAAPDLPPRPATPTPTHQPTDQPAPKSEPESSPVGAHIELRVEWTGRELPDLWQALWTVVQWRDAQGRWHDVEGWRGGLDGAPGGIGCKTWWLADNLFDQGPFRWLVTQGEGGPELVVSESFYLPGAARQTGQVEVSLAP